MPCPNTIFNKGCMEDINDFINQLMDARKKPKTIEHVCMGCDGTLFEEKEIDCKPVVKGKIVKVKAKAFVCAKCGFDFMNTDQLNKLHKIAVRETNGT